jgi:hypothetical protein
MMPTFFTSLKFRTAYFPQYGFKAGLSEGAFPARRSIVAPIWFASLFRTPRFQTCLPPLGVGAVVRLSAAIRATMVALPQGSSLVKRSLPADLDTGAGYGDITIVIRFGLAHDLRTTWQLLQLA